MEDGAGCMALYTPAGTPRFPQQVPPAPVREVPFLFCFVFLQEFKTFPQKSKQIIQVYRFKQTLYHQKSFPNPMSSVYQGTRQRNNKKNIQPNKSWNVKYTKYKWHILYSIIYRLFVMYFSPISSKCDKLRPFFIFFLLILVDASESTSQETIFMQK